LTKTKIYNWKNIFGKNGRHDDLAKMVVTMMLKGAFRLASELAGLVRDQKGQILIYFSIMMPVMLGLIGLSLEGGRYLMLNSQLQDLADAAALAGAKELDGGADAMCRAKNAAENLLTNDTWWSNVAKAGVQIQDPPIMVFYSALKGIPTANPAPNDVTISYDCVNGANAAFIKVVTVTRAVVPTFLVAVGATSIAQTSATATAGSLYVACNVQPLMLCNPNEPNPFTGNPGDLYGFTVTGNTGGYSPGDFSLLDPAGQTHSSAGDIEKLLAASLPNFCYVDTVSPAQGQKTIDVASGVNVRFDISPTGNPKGIDTTPAPNVIKGDDSNTCLKSQNVTSPPANNATVNQTLDALPGNINMVQVGSSYTGGTMDTIGAGSYWTAHHDNTGWPSINGVPATRYQVYQMERAGPVAWNGTSSETPAPHCASVPTGDDSRRIVSVAIVNCLSQNIQGNSNATAQSNLYADFFLTRPVDKTNVIYAEFVRFVTSQSDGSKLHQIVQLYRDQ